ncbi:uncharacterized protein METZ01_LOCUS406001, partial [marine metagenome]
IRNLYLRQDLNPFWLPSGCHYETRLDQAHIR